MLKIEITLDEYSRIYRTAMQRQDSLIDETISRALKDDKITLVELWKINGAINDSERKVIKKKLKKGN